MMRKNANRLLSAVLILLLAVSVTACGGFKAESKSKPDGAEIKLNGIDEGDQVEVQTAFRFDEGIIKVELESGTVDIAVIEIFPDYADSEIYAEGETLLEAGGLVDGDELIVSGVKREAVVRITGKDAKGIITISPKD